MLRLNSRLLLSLYGSETSWFYGLNVTIFYCILDLATIVRFIDVRLTAFATKYYVVVVKSRFGAISYSEPPENFRQ